MNTVKLQKIKMLLNAPKKMKKICIFKFFVYLMSAPKSKNYEVNFINCDMPGVFFYDHRDSLFAALCSH